MLKTLYIENIAVIERAEINFQEGFHVLSGETGAGKSIIIDAIHALSGGRVSRDLIRTGQTRASVTALFVNLSRQAECVAEELGFPSEDGSLLLRRELFADGRNTCKVNGLPATLSVLKALSEVLVRIHGQHDGQHLLNEQLHIDYLDAFGMQQADIEAYQGEYDKLLGLNRRLRNLSMSTAEKERRRETLPVEIERLAAAAVRPGEEDELMALRAQLRSRSNVAQALQDALSYLDDGEGNLGAATLLSMAGKCFSAGEKYSESLENMSSKAKELSILAKDLSEEAAVLFADLGYSEQQLEETESRLDLIASLVRRYKVPADELEAYLADLAQELDELNHLDDRREELENLYARQRQKVFDLSADLHKKRVQAAEEISARIQQELADLDLPKARFVVEVQDLKTASQTKFTRKGTDNVRFLLSANAGEEVKPLNKVASGGELSRIMLAMKHVLSAGEEGITMIFDEIDTGVSGRAANQVGRKLYAIAAGRQVLCITHLPQIAALADHQYYIQKFSEKGRTFTRVTYLDNVGRAEELARLTAGEHRSETILESARELLREAECEKVHLRTKK